MSRSRIATAALAFLGATSAVLAMAGAASASLPPRVTTAVTYVQDRPDSGNAGYWADDTMTRELTITRTGGTPGDYTYTAKLTDDGTFTTIKGALAPNQGASYAGDVIASKVTGPMTGYADFSFTASTLPSAVLNSGVPFLENDHGNVPSDSTSTWYELAFPAGTTFGGTGIGDWSWTYDATVTVVTSEKVCLAPGFCWTIPVDRTVRQQWTDGWDNGYGDLAGDGQITG